jgi:cytochrome oxidase Cu insertion factor (SCO1/SenC/PrrC family)
MRYVKHVLALGLVVAAPVVLPLRAAVAQAPGTAPAPAVELKTGDRAPDFNLPGTDGKTYSLSGLKGKTVVLAWFPKAFTGG